MHYSGQDMLWLIGSLSRVFRLPFDAHLVRQQFPPPYSRTALFNALQALDFKVGEMELDEESIATLERIPFPVVAFVRDEEEPGGDSELQEATLSPNPSHAANPSPQSSGETTSQSTKPASWQVSGYPASGESVARGAKPGKRERQSSILEGGEYNSAANTGEPDALPKSATPVLLIKADAERVLFFRAGIQQPETILLTEFSQHFRTDILLVARDTTQTTADLPPVSD